MGWFKRNWIFVLMSAVTVCALAFIAFAVDQFVDLSSVLKPSATPDRTPYATSGIEDGDDGGRSAPATGKEFRNRAAKAAELVKAWPEYGPYSRYDLELTLDPDAKKLAGRLDFTYRNDESQPMGELRFLLYANSHEKEQYALFEASQMDEAYPNGFSPGSIAIQSVTSPDGKAEYLVTGEQKHVLQVRLPRPVEPGQTAKLTITYTVTVPNCLGRFGYGDSTISLVNCHPILAVFNGGKWFEYPYYNMGDPFFSETADYAATITAPSDWTIAATGVLTRQDRGKNAVWMVDAPGRRDFGFVASDSFEVLEREADGVLIRSYYLQGHKGAGRAALDCGVESIELFNETFGEYPYSEFSVVEADFFIGGMEYPGMVLIDTSLYGSAGRNLILDLVVAHETGHQWWYSTVGNDEVLEPWLDEGLTEFTTQYFFEKERDADFNEYYAMMNRQYEDMRRIEGRGHSVTQPVFAYDDGMTYSSWIYDRTAQILKELRAQIGDGAFFSALRDYYAGNRLGVVTRADLEEAFENASGSELTAWFEQRFDQPGGR